MPALIINKYLVFISCLSVMIMLMPSHYRELFYFNIQLTYQGDYWRYLTGHFTHYSWLHCLSNLAGLYLLCLVFPNKGYKLNWFSASLFVIFSISLGLLVTSEIMKWYVGYSGVLIGLLSYSSVRTFAQNALLSFAFLLLTTTYIAGQTIFGGELVDAVVISGVSASSYAHLFGLISGVIYGIFENLKDYALKHY